MRPRELLTDFVFLPLVSWSTYTSIYSFSFSLAPHLGLGRLITQSLTRMPNGDTGRRHSDAQVSKGRLALEGVQ